MVIRHWFSALVLVAAFACDIDDGTATPDAGGDASIFVCSFPPNADTFSDASASGCRPGAPGRACEVSNGATVEADGSVSGGTESCKSLCPSASYELSCSSGPTDIQASIPSPDPALDCAAIAVPTPSNWLYYCCPCGG